MKPGAILFHNLRRVCLDFRYNIDKLSNSDSSRRSFLRLLANGGVALSVLPRSRAQEPALSGAREGLLDEIERGACHYFYEMADPDTGLVLDRVRVDGRYQPGVSSIAATGFGLSALCIADERGYLSRSAAKARVQRTLAFLAARVEHERGFFYHFLDSSTGKRVWKSEASSIDTTWLLCGALHCQAHWDDDEIRRLASELLNRADWRWMLNGSQTLSHGWTPEEGFLSYRWDRYSELLAMYLLAIGSESNAIPPSSWDAWTRPMRSYNGIFVIDDSTPLFVHQYSHAWFDFRDRRDKYADYFRNSQRATQAHRLYCMQLSDRFPWYGPTMWGVTASGFAALDIASGVLPPPHLTAHWCPARPAARLSSFRRYVARCSKRCGSATATRCGASMVLWMPFTRKRTGSARMPSVLTSALCS